MNKYIISIDGGGTKTLGQLYNLKGEVLKEAVSGFSNFYVNKELSLIHLNKVLDELTFDLKKPFDLVIQLGISGSSGIDKQEIESMFNEKYLAKTYLNSDNTLAIYSIKKNTDKNVILMIGGTGSSISYTNDDEIGQIGGYGHLLGDEGSAYHASITALKYVITQLENSEELSLLSKAILKRINGKKETDIKNFVYGNSKNEVASISLIVDEFKLKNNIKANEIIEFEALSAVKQIIYAYQKMKSKDNLIIALRGSFLLKASGVKELIHRELLKKIQNFEFDIKEDIPVIGGYYMGINKYKVGDC
jgi:N-acetylglucosamine kinase-like BadF-type ATPase